MTDAEYIYAERIAILTQGEREPTEDEIRMAREDVARFERERTQE